MKTEYKIVPSDAFPGKYYVRLYTSPISYLTTNFESRSGNSEPKEEFYFETMEQATLAIMAAKIRGDIS